MRFAPLALAAALAISPSLGAQQAPARPLARLASEQMLVLPVQYLTFADSLGWSQQAPATRSYLSSVDDEITYALQERGLKGQWVFPADVERSAKRNAGYVADPHALTAVEVRPGSKLDAWQLREPFASQLRSLVALTDARYVLLPVELKLTGSNGTGRAVLHLVVIDARRAQVQWAGDLQGAPVARFSPAIAADLASRLADLIAPPLN
jgi:hypothetical protein